MTKEYDTIASLWHSFYQLMSTSGQEPDISEEQPGLPGTGSHVVTMKQGQQQK
jgi:DASH complex subunit DAD1